MKYITNYLQDKPVIGIASGFGSGCILTVQNFLTDEHVLKVVAGLAAWAGLLVAVLSLFAWSIKIYDIIIVRIKIKKS